MVVARTRTKLYPIQISSPEGLIVHNKLGTGLFDITIVKEGYVTKLLRNNRVKLGRSLDLGNVQMQFADIIITIGPNETLVVFGPDSPQWAIGNTINTKNITTGAGIASLNLFSANNENSPYQGFADVILTNDQEITELINAQDFKPYAKVFSRFL